MKINQLSFLTYEKKVHLIQTINEKGFTLTTRSGRKVKGTIGGAKLEFPKVGNFEEGIECEITWSKAISLFNGDSKNVNV
jgi:hypothetical protein